MTDYNTDPAYEGIRLPPPPPRGDGKPNYDDMLLPPTTPRQQRATAAAPATKKGGENVPLWCGLMLVLAAVNVWFGIANGSTPNFIVAALLAGAAVYYWQKHTADRPRADDTDDTDMVTLHNGRRVTRAQYEDLAARSEAHRQAQGQSDGNVPPRPAQPRREGFTDYEEALRRAAAEGE